MTLTLQYMVVGLVLGSVYAIAASGLTLTYVSTGILNFAFGAEAFFVARFYYYLHTQHKWGILASAFTSMFLAAPAMGVLLWAVLFRFLRQTPQLIKIVSTIGLSVAIPEIAVRLFGNKNISTIPGLAPAPVRSFLLRVGTGDAATVAINMDQIISYIAVVVVVLLGTAILRFTDVGLKVRAMVDSPAQASLSGVSANKIAIGVWAATTFMAGLAGVLAAPVIGLDYGGFALLMAAAFAAVVAAQLKSVPISVIFGLLMGIAGTLVQRYYPAKSTLSGAVLPSIPFLLIVFVLVYQLLRRGRVAESSTTGGKLDSAILPQGGNLAALAGGEVTAESTRLVRRGAFITVIIVALFPLIPGIKGDDFWLGQTSKAIALAIAFLSYTLVTGEGGMIWLCQVGFALVGAATTSQLATNYHWPVLLAIVVGGLITAALGTLVGLLTIRLGELYVALVTLTFGLLIERVLTTLPRFYRAGTGLQVDRPVHLQSPTAFVYLCLAIFIVIALLIVNLRRSTAGLALSAVRWSEPASQTLGISIVQMRLLVSAVGAFTAGIGGGMLSLNAGVANVRNFPTLLGLTWLAVLVTNGIRSNTAALIGGLSFAFIPAIFLTYLSAGWQNVPAMLFGFGAVLVARYPDGTLAQNARSVLAMRAKRQARAAEAVTGS